MTSTDSLSPARFSVFPARAVPVVCAFLALSPVALFADAGKTAAGSVGGNAAASSVVAAPKSPVPAKSGLTGTPVEIGASVRAAIDAAFALRDRDKIIAALVAVVDRQGKPVDKKAVLSVLADFEERSGLLPAAEKHYSDAAYADSAARDDGCLLDSARCAFSSGDLDRANGLVRAVLVSNFDEAILLRARVYAVWIQLASGDRAAALAQFRAFSVNPVFSGYAPALLFTLWWSDGDETAKQSLLDSYANSPEAAIVRGDISLGANPFWFLMDRNDALVSAFADAGNAALSKASSAVSPKPPQSSSTDKPTESARATVTASSSASSDPASSAASPLPVADSVKKGAAAVDAAPSAGKRWQQVGFFKNREYAEELMGKLVKLGFSPVIRDEKRPSGTVYFSVLVPEDSSGAAGDRLKDAGFETFLLID